MPWTSTTTRATGYLVTAAVWNAEHVDNMQFLEEVNYTQFTSDVAISATSEATANSVVSSGAISYENVPHLIEFYSPHVTNQSDVLLRLVLYDSTTALGEIAHVRTVATGGTVRVPVYAVHRLTPTAASHTYNVKGWTASGAGNVGGGAGGTGAAMPGFIRITRIPT